MEQRLAELEEKLDILSNSVSEHSKTIEILIDVISKNRDSQAELNDTFLSIIKSNGNSLEKVIADISTISEIIFKK